MDMVSVTLSSNFASNSVDGKVGVDVLAEFPLLLLLLCTCIYRIINKDLEIRRLHFICKATIIIPPKYRLQA